MLKSLYNNVKNDFPYFGLSVLSGIISALFITAFKITAEYVIHLSSQIYVLVKANPIYVPILIVSAAVIGLISRCVLLACHSCRGGGIPTSVAAIQGIITFKWFISIIVLPISALLTFFCGVPLGTEGPCVQLGTAIGDGVVKCFGGKKSLGWRRYIMTGGATAGFSIATSSPITAIIFSMEELHKRFSPILVVGASLSVASAQVTIKLLSVFGINSDKLFELPNFDALSFKSFYAPLLVGLICGICSILFTLFYHHIDNLMHHICKKISRKFIFPIIFAVASITGIYVSGVLGTGHSLINEIISNRPICYSLIIIFIIRMLYTMIANTSGVTGGLFLPTLAFGAIIGSLCADLMISLNILESEHYVLMVIFGISAFLGSTSRIPITACVFAIEALGGINNILPIIIATMISYLIAEVSGLEDFTDTVIDAKIRSINKNKEPETVISTLTVKQDSFAIGKKISEILWPTSCSVISFERSRKSADNSLIESGDVITICYKTYNPEIINNELDILVGKQV